MNIQPIEKPVNDPLGKIEVVSIVDTIQGEGPHVGTPAVFVRLAGCNLQCPHCDTDYTSSRRLLSPDKILSAIKYRGRQLVVLTGGEPFRQNISLLVDAIVSEGLLVQIETNGTLSPPVEPDDPKWRDVGIVCCPKTPQVHPALRAMVTAWKYVVEEGKIDPHDGLPTSSLGMNRPPARPTDFSEPIYVQPMDSGDPSRNRANVEAAVESCMTHGYRLCLQVHKIIGMP